MSSVEKLTARIGKDQRRLILIVAYGVCGGNEGERRLLFVRRLRLPFSVDRRFFPFTLPRMIRDAVMLLFPVKNLCEIRFAVVTPSLF